MGNVTETEVRAAVVMLRMWHPTMLAVFREIERRLNSLETASNQPVQPRFAAVCAAAGTAPVLRLDQLIDPTQEQAKDAALAEVKAAVAALRGTPGDTAPADLDEIGAALLRALGDGAAPEADGGARPSG